MNTIQITTADGVVNYTEAEVLRYIDKAKGIDELNDLLNKQYQTIRSIKENVRDFFSEVEWEDGEQTVTKSDVNELLERIGSHKLTSRYGGTFTITGETIQGGESQDSAACNFIKSQAYAPHHHVNNSTGAWVKRSAGTSPYTFIDYESAVTEQNRDIKVIKPLHITQVDLFHRHLGCMKLGAKSIQYSKRGIMTAFEITTA